MKPLRRYLRSACAFGAVSAFVFFLIASAPHRVHHLFENLPRLGGDTREETAALRALAPAPDAADPDRLHTHPSVKVGHHPHSDHHHEHSGRNADHRYHHDEEKDLERQALAIDDRVQAEHPPLPEAPLHTHAPLDDAHHDNSAQTVCLLQSAAQQSHFSASQSVIVAFLRSESDERTAVILHRPSLFNPAPLSQRAPPRA